MICDFLTISVVAVVDLEDHHFGAQTLRLFGA
jgi:hypothetical protein